MGSRRYWSLNNASSLNHGNKRFARATKGHLGKQTPRAWCCGNSRSEHRGLSVKSSSCSRSTPGCFLSNLIFSSGVSDVAAVVIASSSCAPAPQAPHPGALTFAVHSMSTPLYPNHNYFTPPGLPSTQIYLQPRARHTVNLPSLNGRHSTQIEVKHQP